MDKIKKILLYNLCLLAVLLTSCNGVSTHEPLYNSQDTELNMSIFVRGRNNDDQLSNWIEELQNRFNILLYVNISAVSHITNISGEAQKQKIEKYGQKGLVFFPDRSASYIFNLIENKSILPLDEYLNDNKTWMNFLDEMKDMFRIQGKTWAIPAYFDPVGTGRTYLKDWTSSIPETIDELRELLINYTYGDPNNSGKDDTTGAIYFYPHNFGDIFSAFSCYVQEVTEKNNNRTSTPISWNPVFNRFEDSMLNPQMHNALSYMKDLADTKAILPFTRDIRYGSYYGVIYNENIQDRYVSYELRGPNEKYIYPIFANYEPGGFYVLSAITDKPYSEVNAFIDIFYGSAEGHFLGRYGLPENFILEHSCN